jgi:hypothetical protein
MLENPGYTALEAETPDRALRLALRMCKALSGKNR